MLIYNPATKVLKVSNVCTGRKLIQKGEDKKEDEKYKEVKIPMIKDMRRKIDRDTREIPKNSTILKLVTNKQLVKPSNKSGELFWYSRRNRQ